MARLPHCPAQHLADERRRQLVELHHPLRHLVRGQAGAAVVAQRSRRRSSVPARMTTAAVTSSPPEARGRPTTAADTTSGWLQEHLLHLRRAHVEAAGDDDLLHPVDDRHEAVCRHRHDVAGAQPAALEQRRPACPPDGASSPGRPAVRAAAAPRLPGRTVHGRVVGVDHADVGARERHPDGARPTRRSDRVADAPPATSRSSRSPRRADRRSPPPSASTVETGRLIAPEIAKRMLVRSTPFRLVARASAS